MKGIYKCEMFYDLVLDHDVNRKLIPNHTIGDVPVELDDYLYVAKSDVSFACSHCGNIHTKPFSSIS